MKMRNLTYILVGINLSGCLVETRFELKNRTQEPAVSALSISKNFSQALNGFTRPDGQPIKLLIQQNLILAGIADHYECRAGLKTLVSTLSYSDCSNGEFIPTPTAGATQMISHNNGTYRLEVRAKKNGSVVRTANSDFYVHPSLNAVPTCTLPFSESDYFAAAANHLSMARKFGSQTDVTHPPFFKLDFLNDRRDEGVSYSNVKKFISLRKTVVMNGDRSLILVKRNYVGWVDPYSLSTNALQGVSGDTTFSNYLTDQDYACKISYSAWTQGQFNYPMNYHIPAKATLKRKSAFTPFLQNPMMSMTLRCDTLVVNAQGKGLCFHSASLNDPVPLRSMTPAFQQYNEDDVVPSLMAKRGKTKIFRSKIYRSDQWTNELTTGNPIMLESFAKRTLNVNP